MSTADPPRILVIANRTTSTPVLLRTVAERAQAGARFTLLIPPDHGHHDDWSQEAALKLLEPAAGGDVASLDPDTIRSTRSTRPSPTATSTS